MAAANNPLAFQDLFGKVHVEPSVTGIVLMQTVEPVRPGTFNDLILVSPFRSGKPDTLTRFSSLARLADVHDPDGNADQGVALARTSKAPFGDDGVFGSADIVTLRVGDPTQAQTILQESATNLVTIKTTDYGLQANRNRRKLEAGTLANSKKITLWDDKRSFTQDNLGLVLQIQYTGDATTGSMALGRKTSEITYTGQPADGDIIRVNDEVYEFDNNASVGAGNITVTIGVDEDTTFASLATAIGLNTAGVAAVATAASNKVDLTGDDLVGVDARELVDSGAVFAVTNDGDPLALVVKLAGDQTDGSLDINVKLKDAPFKTLQLLAGYIDAQTGYSCKVHVNANPFLLSTYLDVPVEDQDIKTAEITMTAYAWAIADWVNTKTQANYVATVDKSGPEPDEDSDPVWFTGGTNPAPVFADWEDALTLIGDEMERGGILLLDTDDETVMAATVTFIAEQQSQGRWFRAYFGANSKTGESSLNDRIEKWLALSGSLDSSRVRLYCQRVGVFEAGGTINYLAPVFLAAAMAGGTAGNKPYINPLTNKRLRFVGLHEDDDWDVEDRERLLAGGLTVLKREEDLLKVALHVTTSQDPDRRMPRIVSEADTVGMIEANMRQAFMQFRGRWAGSSMGSRVLGVGQQVLDFFASPNEGALVSGTDNAGQPVPPWRWDDPAFTMDAGVLKMYYQVYIGGELNHISLLGRAEYQRVVGSLGGGTSDLSTSVPLA